MTASWPGSAPIRRIRYPILSPNTFGRRRGRHEGPTPSGGAFASDYTPPDDDIPVLITWGGPADTYAGYDFHGASLAFSEMLAADGHFTVVCEHGAGHLPPLETPSMLSAFFADHRKGADSPWRDGLPGSLPGWCE